MTLLSPARASSLLGAIAGRRLLVLGDLMLDAYHFGSVTRISAEAPVPVVRILRETVRLGGAGNVAANAAALSAEVRLVGVLGADPSSARFRGEMTGLGLDPAGVVDDRSRQTTL